MSPHIVVFKSFSSVVLLAFVVISSLTSCEKCRNVEPLIGTSTLQLSVIDSTGESVFESRYDLTTVRMNREATEEVELDVEPESKTLTFQFLSGSAFDIDYTDEYRLHLDSLTSEQFLMTYRRTEVGECGGWKYEFVNLIHDGQLNIRRSNTDVIEIII